MEHSFRFKLKKSAGAAALKKPASRVPVFKRGGSIKATENIIPNGVLHEEKNNLGDKGMPVIVCDKNMGSCKKKYEIEKDEMIFTKLSTEKVEAFIKEKDFAALGGFLQEQILDNTHSFTDKFKYLNSYSEKNETLFD